MSGSPLGPLSQPIPVALGRPPRPVERTTAAKPVTPLAACVQYFAATASASSWARRHTAEVLERWGVFDLTWSACQVVSELVTNVFVHVDEDRSGAPDSCRVTLKLYPDVLAVEVWDPGDWQPPQARCPDELDESGRGLAIVTALSIAPPLLFNGPGVGTTIVALLARPWAQRLIRLDRRLIWPASDPSGGD